MLANDLDMEGLAGKVIGKYNNGASGEKAFTGIFDGDGHTIRIFLLRAKLCLAM